MANKFFEIKSTKKKEKPQQAPDNFDASIFTNGLGYDANFGPNQEENQEYGGNRFFQEPQQYQDDGQYQDARQYQDDQQYQDVQQNQETPQYYDNSAYHDRRIEEDNHNYQEELPNQTKFSDNLESVDNYSSAPVYDNEVSNTPEEEELPFVKPFFEVPDANTEMVSPKEAEEQGVGDATVLAEEEASNKPERDEEGQEQSKEVDNVFLTPETVLKDETIKNPVYVEQEESLAEAKVNLFIVIGLLIKVLFKPGTTISEAVKKYKDLKKAVKITLYITILIVLLSLGVHVLTGGFKKVYDLNTGSYSTVVDFSNIGKQDYLAITLNTLSISCILILVVSAVYYLLSFIRSKGIHLGTYIMLSNLALFPFLFALTVLYPLGVIVSYYVGFLLVLLALVFSSISFYTVISEIVPFENINEKIFYNVLCLSIVMILLILVIVVFFASDFNEVMNLIGSYL